MCINLASTKFSDFFILTKLAHIKFNDFMNLVSTKLLKSCVLQSPNFNSWYNYILLNSQQFCKFNECFITVNTCSPN